LLQRLRPILASLLSILLVIATLAPAGTARAAGTGDTLTEAEAIELLRTYDIVRGDTTGNLGLNESLTRAQAAALFVRVLGMEEAAKLMKDLVPFTDAKGHWGAGEITMADRMGLMRGDGNGTFRPNAEIRYVEVLTVLLRMVNKEPTGAWQVDRIMSTAAGLRLVPSNVDPMASAVRQKVFWSLAQAIATVPLDTGETVLQKYVDNSPPKLTLDQTNTETASDSLTLSGSAPGATRVTVSSRPASLDKTTGRFTYTASLNEGPNAFTVEAYDLAGNRASAAITVTREARATRMEASGPTAMKVGASEKVTVTLYDNRNQELELRGLQAQVTGDAVTFDTTTLTVKAVKKGRSTLSLSVGTVRKSLTIEVTDTSPSVTQLSIPQVNGGRTVALGKDLTVEVQVLDQNNRLVSDDNWRSVTLTASGAGSVTITPRTATTKAGKATFTVRGTEAGAVNLTANSADLAEVSADMQVVTSTRVVLSATPSALRPDGQGTAIIRATLQDENSRPMSNSSTSDIQVTLRTEGTDGFFVDNTLTIRRGSSTSSGDDGMFQSGLLWGTAVLAGTITSNHAYSVQTVSVPITAGSAPVRLQVTGPNTAQSPGGAPAQITVSVLDASNRVVTAGSFGFQLTLSTSNSDPIVNGMPEGVTLTFQNNDYRPIDDGRSPNDSKNDAYSVVGRTYQGKAVLSLSYVKSGLITITPKLVGVNDNAYHPTLGFGGASPTTNMQVTPAQVTFAAAPARIVLTADSTLGTNLGGGAVSGTTRMKVRAQVVDSNGAPVPGYTGAITLTRGTTGNRVTRISNTAGDSLTRTAANGVADFSIDSLGGVGYDLYTATGSNLTSNTITMAVRTAKAAQPAVTAVRGAKVNDPSPSLGYVAPDDDFMEIQMERQDSLISGEPTHWATVKVYRRGESQPFFTGAVVDLNADPPIIRIPKSSLKVGFYGYEVTVNNGAGDSTRSVSDTLSEAVNATFNSNFRLNSALFDAETGKLALATSGLPSGGKVALDKLAIVKGNNRLVLGSSTVNVTSGTIVIELGAVAAQIDPEVYYGTVNLEAEDGWYATADSGQVARATTAPTVRPMALITHAMLEPSTKRLYLHGAGFTHGTLALNLVKVGSVELRPGSSTTTDRVSNTSDTQITITLSQATFDAINALTGTTVAITAEKGWLKLASGGTTYQAAAITGTSHPLYVKTTVGSAEYDRQADKLTVRGSGFNGATIDPTKFTFRISDTNTNHQLTGATITVVDDSTFTIQLSATDAAFWESSTKGGFSGRSVFMNTAEGWLNDAQGRPGAATPTDSVRFVVPAR
jgi:hypothetical protein